MAHIIRADRPDGSRIPFDPDLCIEYPLPGDEHRRRLLYRAPAEARPGDGDQDEDLWIYREFLWAMTVKNNRLYRPQEISGPCRVVAPEEAREMFREAGLAVPPALADAAPAGPADPPSGTVARPTAENPAPDSPAIGAARLPESPFRAVESGSAPPRVSRSLIGLLKLMDKVKRYRENYRNDVPYTPRHGLEDWDDRAEYIVRMIHATRGYERLVIPCLGEIGDGVNRESVLALVRKLCRSTKLTADEVGKLAVDEAMDLYDSFLPETAAGPSGEPPSGTEATGPAGSAHEELPYHPLGAAPPGRPPYDGTAWFDPAPPTRFWHGVRQWDEDHLHQGFWHLWRIPDSPEVRGVWICCFGFDAHSPYVRRHTGQRYAHWQLTPKQAEQWFAANKQTPPDILFEDIRRAAAGPSVGPADAVPAGLTRPHEGGAGRPADGTEAVGPASGKDLADPASHYSGAVRGSTGWGGDATHGIGSNRIPPY